MKNSRACAHESEMSFLVAGVGFEPTTFWL